MINAFHVPHVYIDFNSLSNCENNQKRQDMLNGQLKNHFAILTALINIDCHDSIEKKYCPKDLQEINLGNVEFSFEEDQGFSGGVMLDNAEYFSINYEANTRNWTVYAVECDMGDYDTPPSEDYIELCTSKDFNDIMEAIIKSYHDIIARHISEYREAEDYEDNVKFAEELYHMQYEK